MSHTACVSRAEAVQKQCVCRGASARARRCAQQTEHSGGFGFQTKVKDCFLKQRRWTCWYSCRENDRQFSLTFCFHFEKLVIFAVYLRLHYGGFPYFFAAESEIQSHSSFKTRMCNDCHLWSVSDIHNHVNYHSSYSRWSCPDAVSSSSICIAFILRHLTSNLIQSTSMHFSSLHFFLHCILWILVSLWWIVFVKFVC